MALPNTYLASENSAMERRARALHRFLVASPIALLLAVGLVSHLKKPPYPHPAGNAEHDRRILAYQARVVTTQTLRKTKGGAPAEGIEGEARAWVEGYASGTLVAVPSAVYEDHLREGVRGEIVRTGLALAGEAAYHADHALDRGLDAQGAEKALLAAEVAQGMRNFEIQAYLQSLLVIRRGVGLVRRAWPTLSPAAREALRLRVKALLTDPGEVDRLVEIERDQLKDYLRRQRFASVAELDDALVTREPREQEARAAKRSAGFNNDQIRALLGEK